MKNTFADMDHTFIIAEAGSNWKVGSYDDDLKRAHDLIKIAARAGADAVKFQTYRPNTIYVQDAGTSDYLSKYDIKENINDIFEYLSMPYEIIPELAKYCQQENILFMSTPFSIKDAKEVDPYVQIHKIASFEINHIRLLEFLAETKKPIIISTGASTFAEIDFAIDILRKKNNENVCILQCTSKYPCPLESLNLSVIPTLKSRYNLPVGLSDHSTDPIISPIMALGYGAKIIEKHFTLDRNLPGPDHPFALIPSELELFVKTVRESEKTIGHGRKEVLEIENELRQFATRSLQAIKDISKGEILKEGVNFDVLRPGNRIRGFDARFLDKINGKKASKNFLLGDGITEYE